MAGTLTTSSAERTIALCDQGIYERCEGTRPLDLLAQGMVESASGNPETAKDLLSKACWSLEGEWKDRATVQLAVAYFRAGEYSEARALLADVPESFDSLLTAALIETDSNPEQALELLAEAGTFDVSRYKWGRWHNQRGMCYRLLGSIDRAREEYEAALYFFGDSPLRAYVENNISAVLAKDDSRATLDRAIPSLSGPHLAHAYERKAQNLLSEGDPRRALEYATWAVDLFTAANHRAWLIEALITRAKVYESIGESGDSIADLFRADEIARYLGDPNLELRTSKQLHESLRDVAKRFHRRSVDLALNSTTSLNSAAHKLQISRPALQEYIRTHGINYTSQTRRSIIKKS